MMLTIEGLLSRPSHVRYDHAGVDFWMNRVGTDAPGVGQELVDTGDEEVCLWRIPIPMLNVPPRSALESLLPLSNDPRILYALSLCGEIRLILFLFGS